MPVFAHPREEIGRGLTGDVLEIGPGHNPFPTAPEARVVVVDKPVREGRDVVWPELVGLPRGPDADLHRDLDTDGLKGIDDRSHDVVVASHVIEHLANPIAALREFDRVLRPAGRLVLVVPDRLLTFDALRPPTPLEHVLDEFYRHVDRVDDDHIREFCQAIYDQPPIHPDPVREWHNPSLLNYELFALHRRRTIHVHCWTPEEFAVLLAGVLAAGLACWKLQTLYVADDLQSPSSNDFGLVLIKTPVCDASDKLCLSFLRDWVETVLGDSGRRSHRLAAVSRVISRDLKAWSCAADAAAIPVACLTDRLTKLRSSVDTRAERVAQMAAALDDLSAQRDEARARLAQILSSRTYQAGRILAAPDRLLRSVFDRFAGR